jgi:hypothetical protein
MGEGAGRANTGVEEKVEGGWEGEEEEGRCGCRYCGGR